MKKNLTLILCLLITKASYGSASFGQASDLFNVGAGARSMSMGSAFTGLADDASAPYFNPAGLAFMDEHQVMAMHAPLFIDTSYNYVSSAHPFGDKWGAVALSDALLLSDGILTTDRFNNVTDSNGSMRNNAIFASYARKLLGQKLAVGTNVKLIQQKILGFSDETIGYDLGALYKPVPMLSVGASFANLNAPEITLRSSPDVFRPITRFGAAAEVVKNRLMLTADVIKVQKQDNLFAAGAEFHVNKMFDLRTGYNPNRSYTLGLGINVKTFRIDYAFSDTDLGVFNKVSFTWAWHNIYKTDIKGPVKEGRAVYPLSGFENQIAFKTFVPDQTVARWSMKITNDAGEEVRVLEGDLAAPNPIIWDAKNQVGEPVVDGRYNYNFLVTYKNGKTWQINGEIALDLPKRQNENVIDMNLELNGTQTDQEEVKQP